VTAFEGGTSRGMAALDRFIREGLDGYARRRNRPELRGTSRLSPYLHFGHLGPHTVVWAVRGAGAPEEDADAFLEEMIVRRELAVNYVTFNPRYDSLAGCERWALATLDSRRADPRPNLYGEAQFAGGETHDGLWNAAQAQMVKTGWMHGYLRMYWAKKILEWSPSPEAAFETAVRLNDRWQLDGRDPNGYAGVAWAVGGKHDRPWGPSKPVIGTIRPMSAAGCRRKFDVEAYVRGVADASL
jgi:deoxyribodipyrimidine photo-lyase